MGSAEGEGKEKRVSEVQAAHVVMPRHVRGLPASHGLPQVQDAVFLEAGSFRNKILEERESHSIREQTEQCS